MKVLLAHTPEMRRNYYGDRSLNGLRAAAEVILHESDDTLDAAGLVRAAKDVDIIVADRMTEGRGEIFAQLPRLRAFVRCAVDIRNVDVEAASQAGVLVTRAGPGFVQAVAELALGFMVDLSRGVSRATADYQAGRKVEARMGRQLAGSRIAPSLTVAKGSATSTSMRITLAISASFLVRPTTSSASRSPTSRPRI